MIDAIKNDYSAPVSKQKNTFNNFPQGSYDFEALEAALLDN